MSDTVCLAQFLPVAPRHSGYLGVLPATRLERGPDPSPEELRGWLRLDPMAADCAYVIVRESGSPPVPEALAGGLVRQTILGKIDVPPNAAVILSWPVNGETIGCPIPNGSYEICSSLRHLSAAAGGGASLHTLDLELRGSNGEAVAKNDPRIELQWLGSLSHMGFVLTDEQRLSSVASSDPDLLARFTTSEMGDSLLREGAVLPVMGVRPWVHRIVVVGPGTIIPEWYLGERHATRIHRLTSASGNIAVYRGETLRDWRRRSEMAVGSFPMTGDWRVRVENWRLHGSLTDEVDLSTWTVRLEREFTSEDPTDSAWTDAESDLA